MCLAPVIQPDGPAPTKGEESLAQGKYVFSVVRPEEFGRSQSVARTGQESWPTVLNLVFGPKGQESLAQGLPWVIVPTRISPEGATRYGEHRLRTFETDRVRQFLAPSGRNVYIDLPRVNPGLSFLGHFGPRIGNAQTPSGRVTLNTYQGKPWAMLSWPLRATMGNVQTPSDV
jgi:hypothetical protein